MKDPSRINFGACAFIWMPAKCLGSYNDCRKICEAPAGRDQFEFSPAASWEALGPGIGTRAASDQHSYLWMCLHAKLSQLSAHVDTFVMD